MVYTQQSLPYLAAYYIILPFVGLGWPLNMVEYYGGNKTYNGYFYTLNAYCNCSLSLLVLHYISIVFASRFKLANFMYVGWGRL